MYKSIKLAMVMAIVVATAGCIVAISDENNAIAASDLQQYLNADKTAYVMSGDFSFDDGIAIDKPIEVDGILSLTIGTYTYSGTEPMFIVEDGDVVGVCELEGVLVDLVDLFDLPGHQELHERC